MAAARAEPLTYANAWAKALSDAGADAGISHVSYGGRAIFMVKEICAKARRLCVSYILSSATGALKSARVWAGKPAVRRWILQLPAKIWIAGFLNLAAASMQLNILRFRLHYFYITTIPGAEFQLSLLLSYG